MSAETETSLPSAETAHKELFAQADTRRQLETQLKDDFDPGNPSSPDYSSEDMDSLIDQAVLAGGLFRPEGDKGVPDPNFPGGFLEGANEQWKGILSSIREAKGHYVEEHISELEARSDMSAPPLEAEAQPIRYAMGIVEDLKRQGIIKEETGNDARPDGLFIGNRLLPTSEAARPLLENLRNQTLDLVIQQANSEISEKVSNSTDKSGELSLIVRDAMARGLIDVNLVTLHDPANKGKQTRAELGPVADERGREISNIYRQIIAEELDSLPTADKQQFDRWLQSQRVRAEFPKLRQRGEQYRDEHYSGRDAKGAHEARSRIDELQKMDEQYAAEEPQRKAKEFEDSIKEALLVANGEHDKEAAHEAALSEDREARAQSEVYMEHQAKISELNNIISNTTDRAMLRELRSQLGGLEEEKINATTSEAHKQREITSEAAKRVVKSLSDANEHKISSETVDLSRDDRVELAMATRRGLQLEAIPFKEEKVGGRLRFGRNRGLRIVESYFRSPNNDHLVVVERRAKKSGELLSQTVMTSETPISQKAGFADIVAPREIKELLNKVRQTDMLNLKGRTEDTVGGYRWGDSQNQVNNVGHVVDGGIINSGNVYASYNAEPDLLRPSRKDKPKRQSGWMNWFNGGR